MKKTILLNLLAGFAFCNGFGQTANPGITDSASFLLHKFAQAIGREHYAVTKTKEGLDWSVTFKFVDRGSAVPLEANLRTTAAFVPLGLVVNGNTSRMSTIHDSIVIGTRTATLKVNDSLYTKPLTPHSFPVGGYSPGTVQMVMLQYWKLHGQPKDIHILPEGTIQIHKQGEDTLSFQNGQIILERYVIAGLIWGNELVWTDKQGRLICLITNDAEADKLEMMLEPYESLLPALLSRAAKYGMELFTAAAGMKPQENHLVAIVGGKLARLDGRPDIPDAVILVKNGVIQAAGAKDEISIPSQATLIHAEGKTILPGLWDMHAHFEQAEWGPAYLAAGVTTVRDCGNEFEYINAVKDAIDGGKGVGPHILKAGIIDGPGPNGLGIVRASTAEEAVAAVRRYKDNGFVQIKIYSSVQPPVVKAICDEAHRLGMTVTGHIPEGMTLQQGVDSGMDMVNHMQYVYSVMKRNKDFTIDLHDSVNREVIRFIRDHKVVIDPTIGVFEMIFRSLKDNITAIEPAFYTLPLPLQQIFRNMGMPAAQAERFRPALQSMKQIVKALYDQGIPIVAGTDQGFPGYSVARELELYVESGLSPREALQTATIIPARAMGVDKASGSVETGKQADLILVEGDPLRNISQVRKVTLVMKGGQVYDPGTLHRLVGFSK